jgi:hypothetical protein
MAMTDKEAMVASLLRDALLMIGLPFSMGKIMSFHAGTLNGQAFPAMLSKPLMSSQSGFTVALSPVHRPSAWHGG